MAFITIKEICKILQEDYFVIRRIITSGQVKGLKTGSIWMVDDSKIEIIRSILDSKKSKQAIKKTKTKHIEGFLTLQEASDLSKIPIKGIKGLISTGVLNGYGDESSLIVNKSELEKFLSDFNDENQS